MSEEEKKTGFIGLRITPSMLEEIDALAKADGRSRSNMVGVLIVEALRARASTLGAASKTDRKSG